VRNFSTGCEGTSLIFPARAAEEIKSKLTLRRNDDAIKEPKSREVTELAEGDPGSLPQRAVNPRVLPPAAAEGTTVLPLATPTQGKPDGS